MTQRETKLVKIILDLLHEEDGRQISEVSLHGAVMTKCDVGLDEFNNILTLIDTQGWVTIVTARHQRMRKVNLNDAGEAARLEMRK